MSTLVTLNVFVVLIIFAFSFLFGYFQGRNFGRQEGMTTALNLLDEKQLFTVLRKMRKLE